MELFEKMFIISLILGIGVIGIYCTYNIGRIKQKWRDEGVDEHQLRSEFYRFLDKD